jgi:hypothetical protein
MKIEGFMFMLAQVSQHVTLVKIGKNPVRYDLPFISGKFSFDKLIPSRQ